MYEPGMIALAPDDDIVYVRTNVGWVVFYATEPDYAARSKFTDEDMDEQIELENLALLVLDTDGNVVSH